MTLLECIILPSVCKDYSCTYDISRSALNQSVTCVESVVVTAYCVSLHSLGDNKISDAGCIKLFDALIECRSLQVLK